MPVPKINGAREIGLSGMTLKSGYCVCNENVCCAKVLVHSVVAALGVAVSGCLQVLLWTCLILSVVLRHLDLDHLVLGHVGAKIFSGVGDVGLSGMILKKWILDMVM